MRSLVLILLVILFSACRPDDNTRRPRQKTMIEAVYASGFVVAKDEYQIIAQVDGYVSQQLVEDGDSLQKGDPIFIISSEQQDARSRIAQQSFELARKNNQEDSPVLKEARAALSALTTRKTYDSLNFVRYTNLLRQGATSRAEYDRGKLTYENTQREYEQAFSRYQKLRDQLATELINARNNLLIAGDERGRYVIRSEVEGRLFMTAKKKGELIRRGEVVAVAGRGGYELELNVDEIDVHKLRPGQKVIVRIDAYPGKTFSAKVSRIYPYVDRRLQSVRVDAMLNEQLPASFSGLSLEANIIIQQKDKTIVIPKELLMEGDSVYIRTEEGAEKIHVKTGIQTLDEVEILEGIDSTTILLPVDQR